MYVCVMCVKRRLHAKSVRSIRVCRYATAVREPPRRRVPETSNRAAPQTPQALRGEVEAFAKAFPTVGFEKAAMRYTE